MRDAEQDTTERPKQPRPTGLPIGSYEVEQVAELIQTNGATWLDTLGDCLRALLEGLGGSE